ncbi:hypothetical protein, partial [Corynebacterium kroppenstedtii]|uniref:hypothetical protein n=1 Tax=Corynebacterium kroppenstedtii TaxID=161879 RepID=UPI0026EA62E6
VRLPTATKARLLEWFVLGVPSYRQRFLSDTSAVSRERFYRLVRGCCALVEQLREPFEGAIECDETTFGGAPQFRHLRAHFRRWRVIEAKADQQLAAFLRSCRQNACSGTSAV